MKQQHFLTKKKILIAVIIIAALVVAFLVIGGNRRGRNLFSSITMGNEDLIKVNRNIISAPVARLFLIAETYELAGTYGELGLWNVQADGHPLSEYMIDDLEDDLMVLMEIVAIGQENGIELSSTEHSQVTQAADYYYSQMTTSEMEYFAGRKADVQQAFEYYALAMKTINALAGNADSVVSDDEARVISVQQVVTTEQSAAQSIVEQFNSGHEFSELAFNYSISQVVDRTIGRNDVDPVYAEHAFQLDQGQISEPFQVENEWYVVYCVNNYLAEHTETNRAGILALRHQEAFLESYESALSELDVFINQPAWDLLSFGSGTIQTAVPFWNVYQNYFS